MRIHEYTPTKDAKLGGGLAGDYGRLIIEELKPLIDRTYRTRPDAAHTGLGGSSLGGLVTLHLGFTQARRVRPARRAVAVGVVGQAHHPQDRPADAHQAAAAAVGRHGHRRRAAGAWTMRGC